jgi:uncharacterized protein with NAD-binding domain and iron-sulfur cluster
MWVERPAHVGDKIRVAVLGGGMGALAAAWQLVKLSPHRYDITVYQRGWRLGGKGASGRNRQPGMSLRIEEHGLHILMGFYEQAFHILKSCYDELGPAPADSRHGAIGRWQEVLTGSNHIHVCDRYRDGHTEIWELQLPAKSWDLPGSEPPAEPDIARWIRNGLAFIYDLIRQTPAEAPEDDKETLAEPIHPRRWLERLVQTLIRRETDFTRLRADLLTEATKVSIRWALGLLFRRLGDPERRDPVTTARRRQVITAYFVGANLLGVLDNGLRSKQDFLAAAERLDELDYRDWLHHNTGHIGEAWPELAWNSPLVEAVYDLTFSGRGGFGAGTALYGTLCMLLDYKYQLYYRMNGGMGDVVFAPLYLWLRRHGVKFRFFNRVRELRADGGAISQIAVEEQVELGGEEYDPLFEARGRPCWPSAPLLERLPADVRRRVERSGYDFETAADSFGPVRQLRRGRDFEVAVLGIPVGVFQDEPELVADLVAAHPRFGDMVRGIQTVPTRALQIWTDLDAPGLGWRGHPGMLGAYQRPFASWADMSQVLPLEAWEGKGAARSVHYFCGAYEGAAPDEKHARAAVEQEAVAWLESSFPGLLPSWSWDRMCAPEGRGSERFAAQYWRANVAASDRYVRAAPGTVRHRLAADQSGFENLYLAGDWVKTDLNAGCVEAAAMAGTDAARAIHRRSGDVLPLHRRPATLGAYVDRDADWVLRAPVRAEEVTTAAFLLRADPDALRALCVDQVDNPTAGEVTAQPWPARAGLVLLLCSDLGHVESGDAEHSRLGYFREHDVGFFVPIDVRTRAGSQGLGLLPPYLFVDSAIGLSAGREIYGFSKLLARIDMPVPSRDRGFETPPAVTVSSDVLSHGPNGGSQPGGRVEQGTVLEVIPSSTPASSPPAGRGLAPRTGPGLWQFLPALLGRSLAPPHASLSDKLARGAGFGIPMLFLKQFRDATSPSQACHQSLVRCRAQAALLAAPRRLPGSFTIRLPPHFKPDLAGTLGLRRQVVTRLALELKYDLVLPQGKQLWP